MRFIGLGIIAALFTTMTSAQEMPEIDVSANMSLTSNYVWRGMTQTKDSPAVQGGVDLNYMGVYAGAWGSNVDFGANDNNSMELDLYGGYAGEVAGIGYDIGYIEYVYPNKSNEYNFGEAYFGLSKEFEKFGVSAKYSEGIKTDDTDPENYWEVGVTSSILPYGIGFEASYGDYDNIGYNYMVGLNRSFEKFDLSVAYIDFNHDTDPSADEENFVATLSFSF